jgi:hypothetical protein
VLIYTSATLALTLDASQNATFAGLVIPSQTIGIKGTTTNNNAQAGSDGEVITASASAVSLTTATSANVTSVSLTAGDWDVYSQVLVTPAGTTTTAGSMAGINSTTATLPASTDTSYVQVIFTGTGTNQSIQPGVKRISLSSTTTEYLVVNQTFAISTCTAQGSITARRVR